MKAGFVDELVRGNDTGGGEEVESDAGCDFTRGGVILVSGFWLVGVNDCGWLRWRLLDGHVGGMGEWEDCRDGDGDVINRDGPIGDVGASLE